MTSCTSVNLLPFLKTPLLSLQCFFRQGRYPWKPFKWNPWLGRSWRNLWKSWPLVPWKIWRWVPGRVMSASCDTSISAVEFSKDEVRDVKKSKQHKNTYKYIQIFEHLYSSLVCSLACKVLVDPSWRHWRCQLQSAPGLVPRRDCEANPFRGLLMSTLGTPGCGLSAASFISSCLTRIKRVFFSKMFWQDD